MQERVETSGRKLRRGWTTGTCAAVATRAALCALWCGRRVDSASIRLPRGQQATLPVARVDQGPDWAMASVIKDAGDDPDVTHNASIVVTLRTSPIGRGISFKAGEGVGTVTRPGLKLAVGEPAINPVPRAMIEVEINDMSKRCGRPGDLEVEIAIPGGEALALKTLNSRLGIVGGLSILGTTGIVIPYSCSSWIHSIHRGIDVARAAGLDHLAAATGSTSEAAVKAYYGLTDTGLIDMGDFIGGTLKYLRNHPLPKLTVAGGFGKLVKFAQGAMDLHARRSTLNREMLAEWIKADGLADVALQANTAVEILEKAQACGIDLGDRVAQRVRARAIEATGGRLAVDAMIFNAKSELVGRAVS